MRPPYDPIRLDAFMKAAIEFSDTHEAQFYAGNIAGRDGVDVDIETVKRMADWLAETDRGLLESLGFGKHDITYYRLGFDARHVMTHGGMVGYFRRRRRARQVEQFRTWVPICTAIVAVCFTALTYLRPTQADKERDALREQVATLRAEWQLTAKSLASLHARLDAMPQGPRAPVGRK